MIAIIIILTVLLCAACFLALLGWAAANSIKKDYDAAESLLKERENILDEFKIKLQKYARYIDPDTIKVGTAICNIEYGADACGEIIDMSRYHSDGLIGVTLLTPDPRPLDISPNAPPIDCPSSIVYVGPHGGLTWRSPQFYRSFD